MRRSEFDSADRSLYLGNDSPPGRARQVRLSVTSRARAGVLALLTLGLWLCFHERTVVNDNAASWSSPRGHDGSIYALALSRAGERLATGGEDGLVLVREAGRGELNVLHGRATISCLAFSSDGATLAAAYRDSTVVLWDVSTAMKRATIRSCDAVVMSMAFSSDGAILAAGSDDRIVRIFDVASGTISATPLEHASPVTAVCFAPDGKTLASGCGMGQVVLWNVATRDGRPLIVPSVARGPIQSLAFSPDGSILASADGLDGVTLSVIATGGKHKRFLSADQTILALGFSSDGERLFAARINGNVQLWDITASRERIVVHGAHGAFRSAFSPESGFVVSLCDDYIVRVWDLTTNLSR